MWLLRKIDQYFEEVICGLCLLIIAVSVIVQVVLRFFFSSASVWAEETAVLGMIFAVYFGASMATRERAHIRITMLVNSLPRALQIGCVLLADFLWFCFVALLTFLTILYTKLLFEVTYISPGLGIELKWVQWVMPFALLLMLFRMLQVYWRWSRNKWKGLPL